MIFEIFVNIDIIFKIIEYVYVYLFTESSEKT